MHSVKQAAILIGGKGTRLGDAVRDTPKPLLEVCGRPFVEHVMMNLRRFGFEDFILLAGYQSAVVNERYGEGSGFAKQLRANIRVVVEPSPMGTGGALRFARHLLQEEFLLLNGDSIFDFNYLDLSNCMYPEDANDWVCRVALLPVDKATRYGFVEIQDSRVLAFLEKPERPQSGLINSGIYWIKSALLDFITTVPCSLEQDVFPRIVSQGKMTGRIYRGYFIDIGIPEDLQLAREHLSESMRKPAAFLDRDGTLNHDKGYTHKIEEFRWIDNAKAAIKKLNDAGYLVFVVTNQAGIARGYYDCSAVEALHRWMQDDLASMGAHIDDFRYCPHHPQGTVPELAIACDCRKPKSGMLTSLLDQWNPDTRRSFMLGDSDKDAQAAESIGITGKKIEPSQLLNAVEAMISAGAHID